MIVQQLAACHPTTSVVTSKHDDRLDQISVLTECRPLLQHIVPAETRFRQHPRDSLLTGGASKEQRQTSGLLSRRANSLGLDGPTQRALKLGLLLPEEIACAAKHQSAPLPGHLVDGELSSWRICEHGVTLSQHPAFPDLPPSEALRLGLLLPADTPSLSQGSLVEGDDSKDPDHVFFRDYQRFPNVRPLGQDVLGGLFKRSIPRTSSFSSISPLSSPLSPSFPSPWSTKRHKLTKSGNLVGELVDEAVKQDILDRVRAAGATFRLRLERGDFDIEATNTKLSNPDGAAKTALATVTSKDSSLIGDVAKPKVAPLDYARAYYLELSRARKEGRTNQLAKPLLKHCHTKGHKDFFVLSKIPAAAAKDVNIPRLPSVQLHIRPEDTSASHNCVDTNTTTSHDPVRPEENHNELIGRCESPDSAVTMFRVLKKTRGARRDSGSSGSVTSSHRSDMDSDFVKSPMFPPVLPELQFGDHIVNGDETLGLARMQSIARRYDSHGWRSLSDIQDGCGVDVKANSETEAEAGPRGEEMEQTASSIVDGETLGNCDDTSSDPSASLPPDATAVSINTSTSQTRICKNTLSADTKKVSPDHYTAFPPLRETAATEIRLASSKLSSETSVGAPALLFSSEEYAPGDTPTPDQGEPEADTSPSVSHASQHDHSHRSTPSHNFLENIPVASACSTEPDARLFFGPAFSTSNNGPSNESRALHGNTSLSDEMTVPLPSKSALRIKTSKYSLMPSLEKRTSACIPPLFSPLPTSPASPKISEAAVSMKSSKDNTSTPIGPTSNLAGEVPLSSPALALALSEPEFALPVPGDCADDSTMTTPISPIEEANKAMHELIDEMIDDSIGDAYGDGSGEDECNDNIQSLGARHDEVHLPSMGVATRQKQSVQRGRTATRNDGRQTDDVRSNLGLASTKSLQMQHRLPPPLPLHIAKPLTTRRALTNSDILTASDSLSPQPLAASSTGSRSNSLVIAHRETSQDGDRSCLSGMTSSSSQSKGSATTGSSESVNNCHPSPSGHFTYGDGGQRLRLWKEIPVFDKYQGTLAEQDARAKAAKEEAARVIRERREKKLAAKAERKELKRLKKAEEEESRKIFRVASGVEICIPEEETLPSTQDEISPLRYPMTATLPATGSGRNGGSAAATSPSPRRQQSLPVLRHRASARILSSVFRSNAGSGA